MSDSQRTAKYARQTVKILHGPEHCNTKGESVYTCINDSGQVSIYRKSELELPPIKEYWIVHGFGSFAGYRHCNILTESPCNDTQSHHTHHWLDEDGWHSEVSWQPAEGRKF